LACNLVSPCLGCEPKARVAAFLHSRASLLASNLASPCFGHKPKARVATDSLFENNIWELFDLPSN